MAFGAVFGSKTSLEIFALVLACMVTEFDSLQYETRFGATNTQGLGTGLVASRSERKKKNCVSRL